MLFEHMASCESDSLIFMGTTRGGLVMGSRPVRTLLTTPGGNDYTSHIQSNSRSFAVGKYNGDCMLNLFSAFPLRRIRDVFSNKLALWIWLGA